MRHYSGAVGEIDNVCLYKWYFLVCIAGRNRFLEWIQIGEGMSSTAMKKRKEKKRGAFVGLDTSSFVLSERGKLEGVYKGKARWGNRFPGDRILFMLSVIVGEGFLQVPTERKRFLVQYCTDKGMYDQRCGTV